MTISKRVSRHSYLRLISVSVLVVLASSCNEITDTQLPDGVEGPSTYNNRQGAIRLTQATQNKLSTAIRNYIIESGLLSDELGGAAFDMRSGQQIAFPPHQVRSLARLARGVIGKYVEGETSAWQARLLMYEGYAEILTADGWCSGVPLSTLDFEGDWTYKPGSTTDQIYEHAIILLDSADSRAKDSLQLVSAIRVLKARAYLALGRYADARQAVQGIVDDFQFDLRIAFDAGVSRQAEIPQYDEFLIRASISDNEGKNGLPYLSSNDPRTDAVQLQSSVGGPGVLSFFPRKYLTVGDSSIFILSSGIESKLIIAETALHENNAQRMMVILNTLRTSGSYTIDTTELTEGGERIDTLWHPGGGGVSGLRPLDTPVTFEAQRKLLFSERAAWLFLTGSRQGDLRRLVRKYGVNQAQVYPTGVYTAANGTLDVYGNDISFSLHSSEFINPLFKGCQYDE